MTANPNQPTRYIHTKASARQVPDLLQNIFVAELLCPSSCLWLVSPWVSDIPVIDNRSNGFLAIEPRWVRSQISLSQVLTKLLELGTTVHSATRSDDHNNVFLNRMRGSAAPDGLSIHVHLSDDLHEKGILADGFYLSGSMNFTFNGISLNEEAVQFTVNPSVIAENRIIFSQRWGGENP